MTLNNTLREDARAAVCDGNIPWASLKGGTVLITGASGLIGSALVRTMSLANIEHSLDICLVGHGQNRDRGGALAKEYGMEFICGDIREPFALPGDEGRRVFIFHCAAVTRSSDMIKKPAEVASVMAEGTKNVLETARRLRCESMVYLSSMEVYGQTEPREVFEGDLGHIDLTNPRSCYPESKRFCEALCAAYAVQYGLPVKTARPAQTFGAGTPKDDPRVFAAFARSAAERRDIELHTEGRSRGNYCYISDTVRGLLTVLLKGGDGETYNIANPNASVTIRQMAEILANNICGGEIKVTINIPSDIKERGYAPETGYRLNADKLKQLGWTPEYDLEDMYRRMLKDWQER